MVMDLCNENSDDLLRWRSIISETPPVNDTPEADERTLGETHAPFQRRPWQVSHEEYFQDPYRVIVK